MSDINEKLVKVTLTNETEGTIELKCEIDKVIFFKMFGSYDFQRTVESSIAQRVVKELPINVLNDLMEKIDLNNVAKLTTIEMAKVASGQTQRY